MDLLKCHFKLQVLTLFFLENLIQPVLSHHDRDAAAQSAALRGIPTQASPIVDPAIVCDTYW